MTPHVHVYSLGWVAVLQYQHAHAGDEDESHRHAYMDNLERSIIQPITSDKKLRKPKTNG